MNWALLRNSLAVGSGSALLAVTMGFVSALCLAGLSASARRLALTLAIASLALPSFLVTNSWLDLLSSQGGGHHWLNLNLFSTAGTIWILAMLLWPLTLLVVWGAWQTLQSAHLESDPAIRGRHLIMGVLVPLGRNALFQGLLLSFVLAINNFAVPSILQVKVFPAEAWVRFNTAFDTLGALWLSCPLLIGPLLLLVLFAKTEFAWPRVQHSISPELFRERLGPSFFGFTVGSFGLMLVGSLLLPLAELACAPRTWRELLPAFEAGRRAVLNSFTYAAGAATACLGTSLVLVLIGLKHSRAGMPILGRRFAPGIQLAGRWVSRLAWLPFLLPGVLLGIGLIQVFNRDWSAWFYQSAGIVILAFAIRYFAMSYTLCSHAVANLDRDLMDIARVEGATWLDVLSHVIIPQAGRSLASAWYLVYLLCLWDVESMILIVPPGGDTLSLRIFNLLHYGHNAQVNALCFLLLLLALIPLLSFLFYAETLSRWIKRAPRSAATCFLLISIVALNGCKPSSQSNLDSKLFSGVQVFGARGVGVGQLNKPRSVAVDLQDNLYVVDMTGRVQKFSSNGVYLASWQMPQIENGKPKGMGHDLEGNILLVEPHYSRVNVFSPQGKLIYQWGAHGTNEGQFSMPRGVAVNSRHEVFVSEYQEIERVQKFSYRVSEWSKRSDANSGNAPIQFEVSFGRMGNAPGEFNRAEGLCADSHDRLYVADSCNHRIQVFSPDGKFLRAYGKPGQGLGELSYPYDICVDAQGRQYVCEFGNSRIQVFDAEDKPIEIIGGPGAGPGRFNNPWGVALDSAGNLYVADSQNHRVQKLLRRQ